MKSSDTTMGGAAAAFPQTRWTLILGVDDPRSPQYQENLNYLITLYWKPVYRYVRCSWGKSNEDAKDLTQSFFISLMDRESFQNLSPERGRFRSFLKASLKHFLMQAERDRSRIKRGGGVSVVSLDWGEVDDRIEDARGGRPEDIFDREWTDSLLKNALSQLKRQLSHEGKAVQFELFQKFYFSDGEQLSYDQMSQQYGISKFDVGNSLKSARALLKEIVVGLIRETVADEDEREREFKELFGRAL